jgi:hypothetical protein
MHYNISFFNGRKKRWELYYSKPTLIEARTYAKQWPSQRIMITKEEIIDVIESEKEIKAREKKK